MKFLVPNYSCLQNPCLGGYRPQIPVLSAVLNWICWTPPPEKKSWVRHWSRDAVSHDQNTHTITIPTISTPILLHKPHTSAEGQQQCVARGRTTNCISQVVRSNSGHTFCWSSQPCDSLCRWYYVHVQWKPHCPPLSLQKTPRRHITKPSNNQAIEIFAALPCPHSSTNRPPANIFVLHHLTHNDPNMGRTAQLTSRCCMLYIYSTNIHTEYFKHAA